MTLLTQRAGIILRRAVPDDERNALGPARAGDSRLPQRAGNGPSRGARRRLMLRQMLLDHGLPRRQLQRRRQQAQRQVDEHFRDVGNGPPRHHAGATARRAASCREGQRRTPGPPMPAIAARRSQSAGPI